MPQKRAKKARRNGSKGSNQSSQDGSGSEVDLESVGPCVETVEITESVPQPEPNPLPQETDVSATEIAPQATTETQESAEAEVVVPEVPVAVQEPVDASHSAEEVVAGGEAEAVVDTILPAENVTQEVEDLKVEPHPVEGAVFVESVILPTSTASVEDASFVPLDVKSPEKEDQVLDAAAASPFLTPSGLRSNPAVQHSEFVLSPGTEGEYPLAKADEGTKGIEDDLLRQSVDLATMNLDATQSPAVAGPVGTSADGQVVVTVEAEPFDQTSSPRTDLSGSIPVSATSPLAYPQSPANNQLPPIPTPKVGGTPATPNTNSAMLLPPHTLASSVITVTTEAASPVKSVAFEPETGRMQFQAPSRAEGLDSLTLQADTVLLQSLGANTTPVSIMTTSASPTLSSFHPISFEEAMVSLTGSSGKSWRMANASDASTTVPSRSQSSLFSFLCRCFGSSTALAPQLAADNDAQTMLVNTRFDANVETHRRIIQTIYLFFSGSGETAGTNLPLVGPHWKSIGFASADPASELSSIFDLVCVLFLIEDFGAEAQRIFKISVQHGWNFAAICVSLAGFASKATASGSLNSSYNSSRQVVPVTCKLFVGLLKRLGESECKPEELEAFNRNLSRQCEKQEGAKLILDAAEK